MSGILLYATKLLEVQTKAVSWMAAVDISAQHATAAHPDLLAAAPGPRFDLWNIRRYIDQG